MYPAPPNRYGWMRDRVRLMRSVPSTPLPTSTLSLASPSASMPWAEPM